LAAFTSFTIIANYYPPLIGALGFSEVGTMNSNIDDSIVGLLKTITDILDVADCAFIKNIQFAAKCGWALPLELNEDEFNEVCSQVQYDESKLDEYLCEFYGENDHIFYKSDELEHLFTNYNLKLFYQVKDCFENEKYEICIPGLFSLIEGSLLHFTAGDRVPTQYNSKYIKKLLETGDSHIYVYPIHSLSELLNYYFQPSNFNNSEPSRPNRHWSQHGRSIDIEPNKTDITKLFLFLQLILLTRVWLDQNESMKEESQQKILEVKEKMQKIRRKLYPMKEC